MRRSPVLLAALLVTNACLQSAKGQFTGAEPQAVQPLEWNVLLEDWQLLGPFPKSEDDPDGLATTFVKDEAGLQAGRVAFYEGKLFTWASYTGRMINFRNALNAQNAAGNNKVAYAWTQFSSPVAQKARLAVGYDDQFIAWLNGREISRGTENMWSSLDQEVVEVDLRAGTNTLALKVANFGSAWEALVRLLPAGQLDPLLEFQVTGAGQAERLPIVEIELLDDGSQTIAQHRCSGARTSESFNSAIYQLYADAPAKEPSFARFRVVEPGFSASESTLPWRRVQTGDVKLSLRADRPAEFVVIDASTGQPIEGATIWRGKVREPATADVDGRISLPEFTPLTDRCFVVAAGFVATQVDVKWPRRGIHRVELPSGGRSVVGTIVSNSGEPIAGATVSSGISGSYSPTAVTDEQGRFEFVSLPDSRTRIYPVIEALGFVPKGRFGLDLNQPQTTVRWSLDPGATITGRIVEVVTGEPIAGVTITTGEDRFGSNDPHVTTKSTADGTYELRGVSPGETLVHAFSDSFAPRMEQVHAAVDEPVEVNFSLSTGRPVTGVIRDRDGKPVPDVRLITDTWNGARMFDREARTDTDGRFELAHMPDSAAEVHVLKRGFISQRDLMVTGGETLELTLLPTIVHTITIRDAAQQQIVPELQIAKGYLWNGNRDWSWQSNEWETTRYYDKLKGEMRIEINEQPSTYEIAYRFRATGFREEIVKLPRDLSEGKSIEVRMRPAEVFAGRVVDASSGEPLEGVIVAAVSREDRLRVDQYSDFQTPWEFMQNRRSTAVSSTTDRSGRFRLPVQNAMAEGAGLALLAQDGGFHFIDGKMLGMVSTTTADAAARQQSELELPMPASASLSGRLTVAGKPLVGADVRVQWLGHGRAAQNDWNRAFGVGGQVTTDADGRFSFARLGPGTYQFNRVFTIPLGEGRSMMAYLASQNITLLPGEDAVHDIARPAGLTLSGLVKNSDGQPVSGCVTYVATAGEQNNRLDGVISDASGRFSFEHLPPGDYQLTAELNGRRAEGYYDTVARGMTSVHLATARDNVEITLGETNRDATPAAPTLAGTLAPEFAVTPLGSDQPIVLSEHYGKVVVICYWGADNQSAATLNAVYQRFQARPDVEFVPVFQQNATVLELRRPRFTEQPEFPLITGDDLYSPPLSELLSGIYGNRLCYVIGKDGRFASEPVALQQLGPAIEQALASPLEEPLSPARAAALNITLSSDKSERGIPGARLRLQAIDTDGQTVREDTYEISGTPRAVRWHYPPLDGAGKLQIELSGAGIAPQRQTVNQPSQLESITFDSSSPRRITGTVINLATRQPEADVALMLRNDRGQILKAKSDSTGQIDVACYPGTYRVSVAQGGGFALANEDAHIVNVGETSDPASTEIKVAPVTAVKGRVLDVAGEPVSGAMVMTQGASFAIASESGRFELQGVSSLGTTRIWAASPEEAYGAIQVERPSADKEVTIRIGQGLGGEAVAQAAPTEGQTLPPLNVSTLAGIETTWQTDSESERLVVIGALWHPEMKTLIAHARDWCEQHGKPLHVISLDWSLEQARRESKRLGVSEHTVFAGPGRLSLNDQWSSIPGRTAMLVSKEGKTARAELD